MLMSVFAQAHTYILYKVYIKLELVDVDIAQKSPVAIENYYRNIPISLLSYRSIVQRFQFRFSKIDIRNETFSTNNIDWRLQLQNFRNKQMNKASTISTTIAIAMRF